MPIVVDETGIVDSCLQTDVLVGGFGNISVSNPFDEAGLEVVWDDKRCAGLSQVTLRFGDAGYELIGRCSSEAVSTGLPLYLLLRESLPAELVHAYLEGEADATPLPTPTLPPPVAPPTDPDPQLSARERIDRFWESFGNVGCLGMLPPESIETVADWSDLIVIGRPTGAQAWEHTPWPITDSLITLQVSEVIKGLPNFQQGEFIQLAGTEIPSANIADLDHLLFLTGDSRDDRVYFLTDSFTSIFANVDGRVVTAEYEAIKDAYGHHLFPTDLDGTDFDRLVDRILHPQPTPDAVMQLLGRRGYFAC